MEELKAQIEGLDPAQTEKLLIELRKVVPQRRGRKMLVSLVESEGDFDESALKLSLSNTLPEYMVPNRIVAVDSIPRLSNGKPDLRNAGSLITAEDTDEDGRVASAVEQTLQTIWSDILGYKDVGLEDNFFEIGGDSILSIQIVAKAKSEGLNIKPTDIFEHQTIAELSKVIGVGEESGESEASEGLVPLMPIQMWFLENHIADKDHWNQGIQLELPKDTSIEEIREVLSGLVETTDVFRMRFRIGENGWEGHLVSSDEFGFLDVDEEEAVEGAIKKLCAQFSIEVGPLFGAVFLRTDEKAMLSLVAHHLVVDPVSWSFIADRISSILDKGTGKSEGYVTRVRKFFEYFSIEEIVSSEPFWKAQRANSEGVGSLPGIDLPLTEQKVGRSEFSIQCEIDSKTAEARAIAAVSESIMSIWEREDLLVGLERQIRTSKSVDIRLDGSVGWLTSYFPLLVKRAEDRRKLTDNVISSLETIPDDGFSYGYLRYIQGDAALDQTPDILVNYLGKESKPNFAVIRNNMRSPISEREYAVEVNCSRRENAFSFSIVYPKAWSESNFVADLERLLFEILNETSDAGLDKAGLSADDFSSLMDQID